MISGSIDLIDNTRAIGWIASRGTPGPFSVEAVLNREVIGRAVASNPRPDLANAGFLDHNCGFEIVFTREIESTFLPFIAVHLADSDLTLPKFTVSGYRNYFEVLYNKYPAAARPGTLIGGLWTDRSDAAARIRGRESIGAISADVAANLARFVQDGIIKITRTADAAGTAAHASWDNEPKSIADAMFDDSVLSLLRGIFDDHPLAVLARRIEESETDFTQISTQEQLPSPCECVSVVSALGSSPIEIEVIRGGHRFPEFLPDGSSRWLRGTSIHTNELIASGRAQVDTYEINPGETAILGPGTIARVITPKQSQALTVAVIPARLAQLRFRQQRPSGEVSHPSGARIWV